ncbi:MAG: DNA mismatch repair endonuclease MutL [Desulfobacteraceae bacterium]|nr:MAG: DNA mismatch repair endonuclease MutL [Desulfobacteraceae bacterium]
MPRIRILPDILANKIAAGEVVERPASVVKELVENALDAQGSRITIEIENGGRSLIQVADNGSGMGRDDALLSLERFATSKLHSDADLSGICTLGFRGEALPSIAAVSKLTLITREREAAAGVQVQIEGGKMVQVTETGAPQGTLIRVAQLFFNTPARRKFLKSTATEMGHVADVVGGMALAYPQVHFKLLHNARLVKQWPKVNDPIERAADSMGPLAADDLIRVQDQRGELILRGYLAPAGMARSTSRGTIVFVNGRRIRDRVIQHALCEGYHGLIMKGRFPSAVLFLQMPCDQVDVNVHPTKHEVRFADQRRVHDLVRQATAEALSRAERRLWAPAGSGEAVREAQPAYNPVPLTGQAGLRAPAAGTFPDAAQIEKSVPGAAPKPPGFTGRPFFPAPSRQQDLWTAHGFADLTVVGQFRGTYILCQDGDDLILIDQHAAHERILYEQLSQNAERPEAQHLLVPETVELSFSEARMLEHLLPGLGAMGLEIEAFGGTTFAVKAVPSLLSDHDIGRLVRELAERSAEIGLGAGIARVIQECRMVMACHRAVRGNQHLADAQIRRLLVQLDACQNPSHCPHGRPTWIRWTLRDLEKAFGRTG